MSSQRPARLGKRKRDTQNSSRPTPDPSGEQDTPSSGWLLSLPDIPNDQASSLPTELDSNILPMPTEHQSHHSGSCKVHQDTLESLDEGRSTYTWVNWAVLPYYTIDASSGVKKAWWWQYGVPLQYKRGDEKRKAWLCKYCHLDGTDNGLIVVSGGSTAVLRHIYRPQGLPTEPIDMGDP
ncbi:hypothetical protein EJ04DRAFT_527591 [Polyplosphaeria fusca]|uniref:BED-type domain-containing protein n=1 Tax=Polyplosphaeria fusca TaxID=682080 RepID=A0A9P4QQR7_9PLEO|nr:hypothetical protein EJ04DRAFT_527591 [Polyplosphaeria fusca]